MILVSSNSPSSEKTVDEENKKNSELTALSKENGHVNGKIPNGTVDSDKENSKPQANKLSHSLNNGSSSDSLDKNNRTPVGINNRQKKLSNARDEVDTAPTNGTIPKIAVSEDKVSPSDAKITESKPDRNMMDSDKERKMSSGRRPVSVAKEELPSEVFSVEKDKRISVSTDDIKLDLNGDSKTPSVSNGNTRNTRKASRDSTLSNDSFASCSDKIEGSVADVNGDFEEEAVELDGSSTEEIKTKTPTPTTKTPTPTTKTKRKMHVYTSPAFLNNMRSGLRKTNKLESYLE